jgi:cysteine desulfurase
VIESIAEATPASRRTRALYLDYNATTPVAPEVLTSMLPYFADEAANAASSHGPGRRVAAAVEEARSSIAAACGCAPVGLVFTSGATEADNLALAGTWAAAGQGSRRRIITVATEHKAVLETVRRLRYHGADVVVLAVDSMGQIDIDELNAALRSPTLLVSVAAANNETGVIPDLATIITRAHATGALVHSDAAQVLGKLPIDIDGLELDLASLSAHKAYGPKGIGALYVRPGLALEPLVVGGGHEGGLRSGTLNVPAIVGFGTAAWLAVARMERDGHELASLRDELWGLLAEAIPTARRNGPEDGLLPNTLNVRIPGIDADDLLLACPRLAAATGSACTSGSPEPSHVLRAMGLSYEDARSSLRLSLGRPTTREDVGEAVFELTGAVARVRGAA